MGARYTIGTPQLGWNSEVANANANPRVPSSRAAERRNYLGQHVLVLLKSRRPHKSAYLKIIFLISQPKHMLWVLKRTVSMRLFFWAAKTHVFNWWISKWSQFYADILYLTGPMYNNSQYGHRPIIVKRAVNGSKGGWKLSTIFKL